jgi:hypothetical protein
LQHNNPFDINDPKYEPPVVYIDSSTVTNGDSTAAASLTLALSGNKPEVSVRWRLDSLAWSTWQAQGNVTIDGYDIGPHTITAQGRYGEGGDIADTTISFVKVRIPSLVADTASLLDDSLVTINAGTLCTLRVSADGSGKLMYYWRRSGVTIDSTSGNELVGGPFAAKDSGSYFVAVRNRWGAVSSDTVFLRYVPPVNNSPVVVPDSFTIVEDSTLIVTELQGVLHNDSDMDGDTLSAVLSDSTRNGALSLAVGGGFSYKANADFFGSDSFTYKARDPQNAYSAVAVVHLIVTPINDAPALAKNENIVLNEGQKVTIAATKLKVTDVDNEAPWLIYTLRRLPAHGVMMVIDTILIIGDTYTQKSINDGLVAYQHDGGETTVDTAIVSINDGSGGLIDTVRIVYDITPVNDTPYFANKLDLSVTEGGSRSILNSTLQVKDNDNTPGELVCTITSDVIHGQVRKSGVALGTGATFTQQDIDSGRISYQHDKTNATRDSLAFTVNDGKGGAIAQTWLIIRVGSVDDPPVVIDQGVSTNEDTPLTITLTATDPEGAAISGWGIVRQPEHGTLTGSGAMRTYTPAHDFSGPDTFMFRANDGANWSDTGIVAIAVLPVNDAPIWKQSTVELSVKEGTKISFDLNTVFAKDPENDSVIFVKKSGVGTLTGLTWTWTPGYTAAAASPATCVITATDNGSPVKSADITLTIPVTDSLCRLTTSVTNGNGTIATPGTTFDPGTVVQLIANPAADYVFKNWTGDVPSANQSAATVAITMNGDKSMAAVFVKTIETVTMNIGESYVHGSIYVNGYYYLTTRTNPAKILKMNADNLVDYKEATFPSGFNGAEQVVYSKRTSKLYTVFAGNKTVIAEIDPVTLAYQHDKIVDTLHSTNGGVGHTMAADDDFLYVTVFPSYGITQIVKYSLLTFSTVPVDTITLPGPYYHGHAIRCVNNDVVVMGGNNPMWIVKIKASDMTFLQGYDLPAENHVTDEFAVNGNYYFAGTEAKPSESTAGYIYRISSSNVSQVFSLQTGITIGQCYGVQEALGYVWSIFSTTPGTLVRIDPVAMEFKKYRLDYNIPNEIVSDGKRLLITYWSQNPGRIQAFDPQYLNDREIP